MKFNSQCIPDPRSIFGFAIRSKWRAKCAVNRNKHRHIYIYIYTIYVAFRPFLSVECLCVCDKNSVYVSRSPLFTQCLAPLLRKTPAHFPVNPRKRTKCSSFAWFPNMQFMFFSGNIGFESLQTFHLYTGMSWGRWKFTTVVGGCLTTSLEIHLMPS